MIYRYGRVLNSKEECSVERGNFEIKPWPVQAIIDINIDNTNANTNTSTSTNTNTNKIQIKHQLQIIRAGESLTPAQVMRLVPLKAPSIFGHCSS